MIDLPGYETDVALSRRELLRSAAALGVSGLLAACSSGGGDRAVRPSAPARRGPVPDPVGYLITRWRADPFALGSYSYLARAAEPGDRSVLAAPVDGRLFFAGEATHRAYPATVHGALLSGRRVAREVVEAGAESVIIVGAGAAGLEAAARLTEAGTAVTVVEGRDRIGGRVWTDDSLGAPLDLGASWIHGVRGNPLSEIADAAGIERVETDYDNAVVLDASGTLVAPDDVPADLELVFAIEQEYAAGVADLNDGAYVEGAEFPGGDVVFPGGYAELVEELFDGPIRLGVIVDAIARAAEGVRVETSVGTIMADAVVVTVPLGVLKAAAIAFDPPLPAEKLGAIDRLGMGLLDKVCLRFDEVFWDPDTEFFGHVGSSRDRFVLWFNVAAYSGEPILMAFNAASAAEAVGALADHSIIAEAMTALRAMFGPA